jgi:hypothetical protein
MKMQTLVDSLQVRDAFAASVKQAPYVVATVLTKLALDTRNALRKEMGQVFDRPTDFTLRGVYTQGATKSKLQADVYVPDSEEQRGKSAHESIRPGALGTSNRHQKKTEYLLSADGFLPPGWVAVPGSYMRSKLDSYGNMPGRYYAQIIRSLQIKRTKGPPKPVSAASQKRAVKMKVVNEFFAVTPGKNTLGKGGGWLPSGVYQRAGRDGTVLLQYLKFVAKAAYKQRLNINQVAADTIQKNLATRWAESTALITERFARNGPR